MSSSLIIDVEPRAGDGTPGDTQAPVVVVEPLLAGPAVALALDSGLDRVRLEPTGAKPDLPTLLEGEPPAGAAVTGIDELMDSLAREALHGARSAILVSHLNIRPCAALLGGWIAATPDVSRLRIACVPTGGSERMISADAMQLAGALARILLEEVDRPAVLTEAAGIAMTVAESFHDPVGVLEAGERWRRLRDQSIMSAAVLEVAGLRNTVGIVPIVSLVEDVRAAVAWQPVTAPHPGGHTG
jgi:hypothetical protein